MNEKMIIDQCVKTWEQRVAQASKLIDSLSEWAMDKEVAPGRNKVVYVIGHLLVVHDKLVEGMEFGERSYADLDPLFLDAQQPDAKYPETAWIKENWHKLNEFLNQKFNEMPVADWLSKHAYVSAEDFALQPERNKLNLLLSRTNHLSSHNGQLVLVKKTD
ncbi:DinB family protein [Mucilaginibacter sp. BJC16-A38]|uniref:DinB family protein n=1 Tax=Mucilaginibacter phenanthrenivorans TaxID=1234842 RepID=UPI002157FED3|nr:DinB family protein [Mucilaginibacter phenanthrenivorans]MCR8560310.1 DinB family protein [Mucilaginibacter phenanthrenivorans]